MADHKDLMSAEGATTGYIRDAQAVDWGTPEYGVVAIVHSNLAIAAAIREASMRIEIALREAAGLVMR